MDARRVTLIKGETVHRLARGCVYEFSSFTGGFAIPFESFAYSELSATGKLNKKASASGCATTLMETVELYSAMFSYGEVI